MTDSNALSFEALDAKIRKAPFHQWLGVRLTRLEADAIEITADWRDEYLTSVEPSYAHGGILAALIDLTADFAVAAKIGRGGPTIDMRVDFLRPATPGALRVVGRTIKLGRTLATAEAEIFTAAGKLAASGRGVFFLG